MSHLRNVCIYFLHGCLHLLLHHLGSEQDSPFPAAILFVLCKHANVLPLPSLQLPARHPTNAVVQSINDDDDVVVRSLLPYAACLQAIDIHLIIFSPS